MHQTISPETATSGARPKAKGFTVGRYSFEETVPGSWYCAELDIDILEQRSSRRAALSDFTAWRGSQWLPRSDQTVRTFAKAQAAASAAVREWA